MSTYRSSSSSQLLIEAAECITKALTWSETIEGEDFWREVKRRLGAHYEACRTGQSLGAPSSDVPSGFKATGSSAKPQPYQESIIHVYYVAGSLCGMDFDPRTWPNGHVRVGMIDRTKCTCAECKKILTPEFIKRWEEASKKGTIP